MVPTTPDFFLFLLAVFAGYWLLWRIRAAGAVVILLANLAFFAAWGWVYLLLVPAAATADFFIGRAISNSGNTTIRRALVSASVLMNAGLIVSSRYVPFLLGHATSWTLPLSLSFYAFQAMTYTLDIYRRDAKPSPQFLPYFCSVTFFPTILAGPITRVSSLLTQWNRKTRTITGEEGGRALFLIGTGLAKKFLIADYLANNLIGRVFDLPTLYSSGEVLVAVYAYAFQLYYDFSAYTDIVRGAAALLGFKLPANFNRPYIARNIADFWRRWHISLSDWLRDYLYFSLPGKRSKTMAYINLVVTMMIGGFWHGANWTFLVWGLLHGLGLAAYRGWQAVRGNPKPSNSIWVRFAATFLTFHFVAFAWIFFRAGDLPTAFSILTQIGAMHFSFDNVTVPFLIVLAIAVLAHFTPKNWLTTVETRFTQSPALVQAMLLAGLVVAIQYVGATGAAPFIYTRF